MSKFVLKRHRSLIAGLFLLLGICASCDSLTFTEGGTIYIYNYDDDHEYRVELRLVADDSLVDSCSVDEYPDDGYDDSFEELDEDYYYLSIFKDHGTNESGRSGTFHLEEDESTCYMIEEDGDIKNCD